MKLYTGIGKIVLVKSYPSNGQIIYRYWPNGISEFSLAMHTYKLCISSLATFWNRIPVLTKSYTSNFVNTGIQYQNVGNGTFLDKYVGEMEESELRCMYLIGQEGYYVSILYWWNYKPVLTKSYTNIYEIVYQYWRNHILALIKSYTKKTSWPFPNTGIQFLSIPVHDFVNSSIRFCLYEILWPLLSIEIYTSLFMIWFCQYRYKYPGEPRSLEA